MTMPHLLSTETPRLLRSAHVTSFAAAVGAALALLGCAQPDPKAPGIESMGSPGIAWSEKSYQQRMGYMAAFVHPRSEQLFVAYDSSYEGDFTCETCHGENAELNDYEMPSPELFELPRDNPLEEAREYDAEVTAFMADELTPQFNVWFNQGEGPKTQVTCFSCHPVEE